MLLRQNKCGVYIPNSLRSFITTGGLIYVPRRYGGLDLPLPEGLRIGGALAWTDGSVRWTVTLCSAANWFIGFLQPGIAATLFSSENVCFEGSGRASGIAKMINDDEFEISGSWQYATGAAHATAFTANCQFSFFSILVK